MDEKTKVFLRGAYQYLEKHQQILSELMLVTFSLRKTIRELGPEAEKLYAKHYLAESSGPLKIESDHSTQGLAQLIRQLGNVN